MLLEKSKNAESLAMVGYLPRWETVLPDGRWNSPDGSLFYAMEGNFSRWTVKYIEGQADFNEAGTA